MADPSGSALNPVRHQRPLSPHLGIYRPLLTMMMSIMHRITGIGLYAGALLLAWFLIALASGPEAFGTVAWFLDSIVGRLVLFGFTWALFHHLLGGVRHFLWDAGWGMTHPEREWLAQGTLAGGILLTVLVWVAAFWVR
jgi:succinate dehydrogenase / fumarate reductase, cytochrome b subunit